MTDPRHCSQVTANGTEFWIQEPQPFNLKWYCHKFKGPTLQYEIGVYPNWADCLVEWPIPHRRLAGFEDCAVRSKSLLGQQGMLCGRWRIL